MKKLRLNLNKLLKIMRKKRKKVTQRKKLLKRRQINWRQVKLKILLKIMANKLWKT